MKIGFCVEGSTDRAFLEGLRKLWCPDVEAVQGKFRGEFYRREIPQVCLELRSKGVDLVILLRDANKENWRDVLKGDVKCCAPEDQDVVVVGVCDRNIECWLTADRDYAANFTRRQPQDFAVDDPKKIFEVAFGITPLDHKEPELAQYTREAPLRRWLRNPSFENFYDSLRDKSRALNCSIPNLRESQRQRP